MNLLDVHEIGISFGGLRVLSGITFHIKEHEILGVIGPNGAGKTTLFNLITGIYKPTAGNIQFEGETISGLTSDLITKKGINRTFQNVRLFGNLSVLENVLVGMQLSAPVCCFSYKKSARKRKTSQRKRNGTAEAHGAGGQMEYAGR